MRFLRRFKFFMNIFLRILNKIRFGEVENIGHDEIYNITFQRGYSRRPYRVAPGYSLLENGKVLQKNVVDVFSKFEAPDDAKKIVNQNHFATLDTDKKYTIYGQDGTKIFEMGDDSKYSSVSFLSDDQKVVQVEDKMFGGTFFIINADPQTKFMTEEYSSVELLEDGKRKVTTLKKNNYGQQATYYLNENFLPCSVKFIEKENEEEQEGAKAVEIYPEFDYAPKYKPAFAVCDQNMQALSDQYAKIENVHGHWLATDFEGNKRFIDEKGRNRSYPIDKIVDLGNETLLVKRNHSTNWDIQRQDNLRYVVKGIKKAIHNEKTGLTFGFYGDNAVVFGYDALKMYAVDGDTARLVLNLLNKTRMGSKFIDRVQANPEQMDKTLATIKTVLSSNLEQNPNNSYIKRLTGTSSRSLDRRFINHLIGVYKAREKRDNKTISEIESQISSLESQISSLNTRLKQVRDKKGLASQVYYSTLETKERLERKLSVLIDGLATSVDLETTKEDEYETAISYAGIQCHTPESLRAQKEAENKEETSTFTEAEQSEEDALVSPFPGSQPHTISQDDEKHS